MKYAIIACEVWVVAVVAYAIWINFPASVYVIAGCAATWAGIVGALSLGERAGLW